MRLLWLLEIKLSSKETWFRIQLRERDSLESNQIQ